MNDFTKTLESKSDQINNPDLAGGPMTITIKSVNINLKADQSVSIGLEETDKVFRPGVGMRRLIAEIWGGQPQLFIGRKMVIYRDPDVKFGKDETGGIRISKMSHIDGVRRIVVRVSRQRYKEYTIEPLILADAPPPQDPKPAQDDARKAAMQGKDEFVRWWNANKSLQDMVNPIMDEIKTLTATADAASNDDEPPI